MISRVTSLLSKLHIPNDITFERLTTKINKHPGLQARIKEESRLHRLEIASLQYYTDSTAVSIELL